MTPAFFADADAIVDAIIARIGKRIVLALPLGLGKPVHVVNALFERAAADPTLSLHMFTALSLEKPRYGSELERRFLEPVIQRLFGGYPDLAYTEALHRGALPANIRVEEFFLQAGVALNIPTAQQNYIAANYTHALGYILDRRPNLVGQLVAQRSALSPRYSLSCNTDITLDLLKARRDGRAHFLAVGQVNRELPYMPGEAEVSDDAFELILQNPSLDFPLFAPPNEPIGAAHYAQGFHAAALVDDGGTLQLGIGSTSNAVVKTLIVRQQDNAVFDATLARLSPSDGSPRRSPVFDEGLYAATEMFVEGFLHLHRAGILRREVDGAVLHGGFFLGPRSFYDALRDLPEDQLAKFQMTSISYTNALYGQEDQKRAARRGGRFINTAMMATLLGAVVSDGLEDGRVVSGVGGQFNFVDQAFALDGARSILTVNATRSVGGKVRSNILWSYGHQTIPRHLKDIIVTEYGAADLRGLNDRDTIAAMLAVADSRFQPSLLAAAKRARKIEAAYEIAPAHRDNTPQRIEAALGPARAAGHLPLFPLGTDFDAVEQDLIAPLAFLQAIANHPAALLRVLIRGFRVRPDARDVKALDRMGLNHPTRASDHLYAALLRGALLDARLKKAAVPER